jgi:hypothetical protein
MFTPWLTPRRVTVAESDSISFSDISDSRDIVTPQSVRSVAQGQGRLSTVESDSLLFSDFPALGHCHSAQLELSVSRLGRTQDRLIRLQNSAGWLSEDLSDLTAEDVNVYTVVHCDFEFDSSVGFVIDLSPHQAYPSANTIYIRSVRARFDLE